MKKIQMYDKIKELAEQAGSVYQKNLDVYLLRHDELEKFAELLVRDCASICEINGQSYKHSFTPAKARLAESTSNHCAIMIKRHFGVE